MVRVALVTALRRRVRARVEASQQSLVRPAADQEARPRCLSPLRTRRREGTSRMAACAAAGRRSHGAPSLARGTAPLGSRSHRPGRTRRFRRRREFAAAPLAKQSAQVRQLSVVDLRAQCEVLITFTPSGHAQRAPASCHQSARIERRRNNCAATGARKSTNRHFRFRPLRDECGWRCGGRRTA